MEKRNTEKVLNETHIKLKKYRLYIRIFQIRTKWQKRDSNTG